jgi:hypothetical protein
MSFSASINTVRERDVVILPSELIPKDKFQARAIERVTSLKNC